MTPATSDRTLIDQERASQSALEAALSALNCDITGSNRQNCQCPFHDDTSPSASILERDNVWKVYCHVCIQSWDVWDLRAKAQGCDSADLFRRLGSQASTSRPALPPKIEAPPTAYPSVAALAASLGPICKASWIYDNPATGHVDLAIFKIVKEGAKKQYWQAHQCERGIILKKPAGMQPLYKRDIIRRADTVVVVEGEKCADALNAIGIAATTSPGGAGKAEAADWTPLAGKKCILWPDNDPVDEKTGKRTGVEHMQDVARVLANISPPPAVYWLEVNGLGLPAKGDVADLLEEMDAQPQETCRVTVLGILEDAKCISAAVGVRRIIEDTISGKRAAVPWPWQQMTQLTKALLPGTVTLLCGAAGTTKSFFLMQCLAFWHKNKIEAEIFQLEDNRDYHLHRALAQVANDSRIFDDEWIRNNPEEARAIEEKHRAFLNEISPRIWDSPNEQNTLKELAEWVELRMKNGKRIVVIDPITAATTEDKPWAEDLIFMMAVKKSAVDHGGSVILATHPKKGAGKGKGHAVGMDDMAGGAAYQRFAHTIMYLEAFEPKLVQVASQDAVAASVSNQIINRSMRICKARNGRGSGMTIGLHFNGGSLRFQSLGIIQGKAPAEIPQKSDRPSAFERMQSKPATTDKEDPFT